MKAIRPDDLLGFFPTSSEVHRQVGAEFEVAGFDLESGLPLRYGGPRGIQVVLERLAATGWKATREDDAIIGLAADDTSALTLEPGGQVELSTPPREDAVALASDISSFRQLLASASDGLGIGWLAIGLNPVSAWHEIELVPKKRYDVMTAYLEKQGPLALDMMRRTQSVHVTFDYGDEAEVQRLVQLTNCVTPVVAGMFAHSPIGEGRDLGVRSYRTHIWQQTAPVRCGLSRDAIEGTWSYERYLDWLLDIPLIFVLSPAGEYLDAKGLTGREYFASGFLGVEPKVSDLEWVINQTFPDVRVRRYLECRGADMPPLDLAPALAALWAGLIYDDTARSDTMRCIGDLSFEEHSAFQLALADEGLAATDTRGRTGQRLALELLDASEAALERRGREEGPLLAPVRKLVESGQTPADVLIEAWHGDLDRDPKKLIEYLRVV